MHAPVDALGVAHPPAAPEPRILSLVPSITELLFELDLGTSVVGRTTFCIHPAPGVETVPRIGGTKTPRVDKIRALAPSHLIVNIDENREQDVEALRRFVPHVIVTHPLAPEDNLALYQLLGAVFHRVEAANRLCDEFRRAHASLIEAARRMPARRVLYLIWRKPWMSVSRNTYISRTLELVNWHTVAHDAARRYPEIEPAAACAAGTDIVLFSSEPFPFKQAHIDEFRRQVPCERLTLALIDAEMTSWYGSRAIDGMRYLEQFAPRVLERDGAPRG